MALSDDIRSYIAANGRPTVAVAEAPDVLIVAEIHARLAQPPSIRAFASVAVLRELLRNPTFRWFANESFMNAGPIRLAVRDYWQRGRLPPAFDPAAAGAMDVTEIGRRVLTRRFQLVLDDLRKNPKFILSIGSRINGPARHARLAQHFFEEARDRGLPPTTPGVMLLGANHAAAVPISDAGEQTTRMILARRGLRCISVLVLTDLVDGGAADDMVTPLGDPDPAKGIRLTQLAAKTPVSFNIAEPSTASRPNPFEQVEWAGSTLSTALSRQFEVLVLHKS